MPKPDPEQVWVYRRVPGGAGSVSLRIVKREGGRWVVRDPWNKANPEVFTGATKKACVARLETEGFFFQATR